LECVRLAPSASNRQPWRILQQDGAFHFFLSRDKAYSAMMPHVDLQRIDLGIAMCHFQLSAAELGLAGGWQDEDPRLPATPANYEYIVSFVID
ncbi:MAG: nitroreductase, partial [Candidatus Aminicenantes bacterium]|nr:nitroreductase [Candidatus Aminicenantes bacterium]